MFGLGPATKIYVAVEPVDMRKGFEGLYGLVRDYLGADPLSVHLFLFTNRSHTRLKVLVWDGSVLWVCGKRLERGAVRVAYRDRAECDDAGGGASDVSERHGVHEGAATAELAAQTAGGVEHSGISA